jgi:ABC-type phosphate transport system auxiliary subunit
MPPLDFFFIKKRRAIVKRERNQRDCATVKRRKKLYDGQGLDDTKFTREMTDSLGAFTTASQCAVENLEEKIKKRSLLVGKLQDQIMNMEHDVRNNMNKEFEQVRAYDKHHIQQLKTNLDELYHNSQENRGLVTQQEELIKKLQAKIDLTKGTTVEMAYF